MLVQPMMYVGQELRGPLVLLMMVHMGHMQSRPLMFLMGLDQVIFLIIMEMSMRPLLLLMLIILSMVVDAL